MKFIKLKKRNWLHRHNPFNALLKRKLNNLTLGVSLSSHFNCIPTDQGETEQCYEYQTTQAENAVDGGSYSPMLLLVEVCGYLGIDASQYTGTDQNTAWATLIDPGIPRTDGTHKTYDAIVEIDAENGKDFYDTVQDYIEKYHHPALGGTCWYQDWNQGSNGLVPDTANNEIGGHWYGFYGKVPTGYLGVAFPETDRMDNCGTWGPNAPGSIQGHYLFTRDEVNKYFSIFGCYMPFVTDNLMIQLLGRLSALYVRLADSIGSIGEKLTKKNV